MRSPSLTFPTRTEGGQVVSTYLWHGEPVDVRDSALVAMRTVQLLSDEQMPEFAKAEVLPELLFPDEETRKRGDLMELLVWVLWEAFGIDASADGEREDEYRKPVFDFEQDASRIDASFRAAYSTTAREAMAQTSYADFCGLVGALMENGQDTPLKEAVRYRTAKLPRKATTEQRAAFRSLQRHYALEQTEQEKERSWQAQLARLAEC